MNCIQSWRHKHFCINDRIFFLVFYADISFDTESLNAIFCLLESYVVKEIKELPSNLQYKVHQIPKLKFSLLVLQLSLRYLLKPGVKSRMEM